MRPRKKDKHLPACVHFRHGAYYYVKAGKWARLGTELRPALATYASLFAGSSSQFTALVDETLSSIRSRLSPGSWKQYQSAARKLKIMLAEFAPEQLEQRDIEEMMQNLSKTPRTANLCLAVLRQVLAYGVRMQKLPRNEAIGVKGAGDHKHERLITREEYDRIYAQAGDQLQCFMDLLYLTGQRPMDVLTLRHGNLTDEGIAFVQQKTGAKLVVRWTAELRSVVDRARGLQGNVRALTLFHNRLGRAPGYGVIGEQWRAACKAAKVTDAQLRDLRAMSGTAAEEQGKDATGLLGHRNKEMTDRYLRGRKGKVVDGPSFGQVLDLGQKSNKK